MLITPASSRSRVRKPIVPALALAFAFAGIVLLAVLGLAIGSNPLPPARVVAGLLGQDPGAREIVLGARLPRVVLAVVVGGALGLAGHLMQSLTRNPLADPGLLGIQAGASAAVVSAISFLGITQTSGYVWFALAGAAVGAVVVTLLASGPAAASPVRLVLAGTAISGALTAFVSGVLVMDAFAFSRFRFWDIGSLTTRDLGVLANVGGFLAVGFVVGLVLAPGLDALSLGTATATALGARPTRTRVLAITAVVLLSGGTTAAVGPIGFIGLAVPHLSRAMVGPGHRLALPASVILGAILMQLADLIGRVVLFPQEVGVGIVTAVVGAPLLIWFVRRGRVARL